MHVCLHQGTSSQHYWLKLAKGLRDRPAEDRVASALVLAALHRACCQPQAALDTSALGLQPESASDTEQLQVSRNSTFTACTGG